MSSESDWVKIECEVNAPIERVWKMWTDATLFMQWYGPMGMQIPFAEMDAVVGGSRKICMKMKRQDQTMTMWFSGMYKEVNAPTRLVYTESMCDADGNILSPESMGMPPGHPEVTEVVVALAEAGGKTGMKMVHVGVPADSNGAGGWKQAIDKLVALAEQS